MKSKQLLSFVLAFAAIFLLSAFVLTASADETTTTDAAFTVVDGTPSANPAENYTNLLDGKNSASSFTKWCVSPHTAQTYVVFKASREVVLAGYTFITGNDTYTHQGRNPKAWELYGCNDYETDANGGTWTLISSVTDGEMPVENFTSKYFNVKCDVGYKYFKFVIKEIASTSNNTLFQLCGINFSVNKNVMLGKTAISEGDLVYAGKYTYTYTKNKKTYNVFKKLPWRVLSTNGNDGSTDAMFLLSEYALEEKTYGTKNTPNDGQTYPANWYKSDLYTWLDDTFKPSAFENRELNYIKGTSLSSSVAAPFTDELKGEKFFLLSKDECETFGDNITGAKLFQGNRSYNFWLRTPSVSETDGNTVYSFYGGTSSKSDVDWNDITVRPACNFLTSKILFTVPATEGKTGAVGTLVKNVDYTGNEYKLTMETSDYKVRIVETEVAGMSGGTITFDYRCHIYNSKKVNNHYISAMIVDSDNNVLYYGKVANEQYNDSKTTTGSFDMVLPDDIADGNYTIKFFVEGVNDDQKLDYASDFYDVNLTVKSEDNVVLGTSILTGAQKSNVWLGTYKQSNKSSVEPIRWTVLDTAFKYNADSKNGLFLLTDMVIDKKAYNETDTDVTWATSTVRTWLNGTGTDDFYGTAFSETEKNAVLTTKVKNDDVNNMKGGDDTTDKVFLLSYAEANTEKYFKKDDYFGDATKYVGGYSDSKIVESYKTYKWWLRSPGTSQNRAVFQPSFMTDIVTYEYGIRPAINLDHAAVLFTTAAKDGKPSETGLFKNGVNGGNDYKLTLKDSSSFNLNDTSRRALKNGESVTLQYTKTASMSYISAMIVNAQNKVLYYGWLDKTASGSGSVTFTVPDELTAGTYTVNVFGETRNGDYYVDSASAFSSFTLEVSESEAKAVTTAGKTTLGSLSEVLNVAKNNEGSTVTLLKNYTGDITFDGGKFNFNTGNFTFNGASSGYSQNIRVKKIPN